MSAKDLIEAMRRLPDFRHVRSTKDLAADEMITYAVVQGANILTIGSGESKRLKVLMGNKGSHNKAPLVGLCRRLFAQEMEFYVVRYTQLGTKKCSEEERSLQARFGESNVEGQTSYRDVMRLLRSRLRIQESSTEALLLDLMETHGDILNHALNTASTGAIVEELFGGYWSKSERCPPRDAEQSVGLSNLSMSTESEKALEKWRVAVEKEDAAALADDLRSIPDEDHLERLAQMLWGYATQRDHADSMMAAGAKFLQLGRKQCLTISGYRALVARSQLKATFPTFEAYIQYLFDSLREKGRKILDRVYLEPQAG